MDGVLSDMTKVVTLVAERRQANIEPNATAVSDADFTEVVDQLFQNSRQPRIPGIELGRKFP